MSIVLVDHCVVKFTRLAQALQRWLNVEAFCHCHPSQDWGLIFLQTIASKTAMHRGSDPSREKILCERRFTVINVLFHHL